MLHHLTRTSIGRLIAAIVAAFLFAGTASAQISLGTAASFGVLGGAAVSNVGPTVVTGNLGVSPGTAVSGFPPGTVTPPGTIHAADAVAAQAQSDLTTAYNAVAGTPTMVDLTGTDLGGLVLTPSVYGFTSSAQLTGNLTLDAQGNSAAIFIFKIGTSLITGSGASITLTNGASPCNVFWQVGSSATIGTGSSFAGNILALSSITLASGVNVAGRVLARNGAVTLAGTSVTTCAVVPVVCPVIATSPASMPGGTVGTAYSQLISTTGGGTAPITFAVSSGALPPGLSLDAATGVVSGSPTVFGTYNFTITATDANACFGGRAYSIVVAAAACPAISLSQTVFPSAAIGIAYSQGVSGSGGIGPYSYAVTGTLPAGMVLNAATGVVSGTPTTAGLSSFTITATDSNGCQGARNYSIVVAAVVCPAISITPAAAGAAIVGITYSQSLVVTGGVAPYAFTVVGTLPPGLSVNAATGAITGVPTLAGTYSFTITAQDANGCQTAVAYALSVTNPVVVPPVTIGPGPLPGGTVGTPYVAAVTATGGTAPYTYTIVSGTLPSGITLNPSTGGISGTTPTPGTYTITIQVTDASGGTAQQSFTFTISAAPPGPIPAPGAGGEVAPIPTLSQYGLVLLCLLLGLAAWKPLRTRFMR